MGNRVQSQGITGVLWAATPIRSSGCIPANEERHCWLNDIPDISPAVLGAVETVF